MNYYRHFKQTAELLDKKRWRVAGGTRQVQCAHNLCKLTKKKTVAVRQSLLSLAPHPNNLNLNPHSETEPAADTVTLWTLTRWAQQIAFIKLSSFFFLLAFSYWLRLCALSTRLCAMRRGAAAIQRSRCRTIATIIAPTSANLREYACVWVLGVCLFAGFRRTWPPLCLLHLPFIILVSLLRRVDDGLKRLSRRLLPALLPLLQRSPPAP